MSDRDEIYRQNERLIGDFSFGARTAQVFDDMLDRSVPGYREIQRMIGEIAGDFAQPGTRLYDLGCSTGNTFLALDPLIDPSVSFVGIDASADMLDRARDKLARTPLRRDCDLRSGDLNQGVDVAQASVVVLNLTLQFVRPLYREHLVRQIAAGTVPGGCLLLVEKVLSRDALLNRLFIKYYYAYKQRNGYSELEIAQKREALENVLIPYRVEENIELLRACGYREVDVFFKWYNFCGLLAIR